MDSGRDKMSFYFTLLTGRNEELPLYITGIGREEPQGYVDRDRGYPYYQLAYCTAGRGKYLVGGKEYILEEGMMFYFEPELPHRYYKITDDFSTRWIIFSGKNVKAIMDNVGIGPEHDVLYLYNPDAFLECLDKMEKLVNNNVSDCMVRASGLFYEYITRIKRLSGTDDKMGVRLKTDKAVEYIRNNYMNAISIEDIAGHVMVSTSYLCRIFKYVYDMGPMTYLTYYRINVAKKLLLENPHENIRDISEKTGFQSVSYFGMVFKKHEGCTPKEFRRSFNL